MNVRAVPLLALLLLSACGQAPTTPPTDDDAVVVREHVRVLDAAGREALSAFDLDLADGTGELRFAAGDPAVDALAVDQILVSEPVGSIAPHGFLQRIEAKRAVGDEIVLDTTQANLTDVFEEADIELDTALSPGELDRSHASYEGIRLRTQASVGYDYTLDFDEVLIDSDGDESTTGDQLRLDGAFSFDARASASIDIDCCESLVVPYLNRFAAKARLEESVDVNLSGQLDAGFDERFELTRLEFGSFTVMAGPVPVVFVIDMVISIGANGEFEARFEAGAAQDSVVQVGVEYTDSGGWDDLNEFAFGFDVPTPTIEAAASARAFLRPQVNVELYGLAGPYLYAEAYVEADAELHRAPFWTFTGGVDVGLGFVIDLPVVGELGEWETELAGFSETLRESVNEAPTLEVLSPGDGVRAIEGDVLRFTVRAADREQPRVPVTLRLDGDELDAGRVRNDAERTFVAGPVCTGTPAFTLTATDDAGARTERVINAVVENHVPDTTIREDLLAGDDVLIVAGYYVPVFADAHDVECDVEGNAADSDLISWSGDGVGAGATSELLFRVPPDAAEGSEITLQATYDDGLDEDSATARLTVEALDGRSASPVATVREPQAGITYLYDSPIELEGFAYHPATGSLPSATFTWHIGDGSGFAHLADGKSASFDPWRAPIHPPDECSAGTCRGTYDLRLTIDDGDGETATETIQITIRQDG